MLNRLVACFVLLFVVVVIGRDSANHFNSDVVSFKRMHRSAQKNWNVGYSQKYVYYDSSIRYQEDFDSIKQLVEPGFALVSDLTTSYYAAAALPLYVRNVHRHHGVYPEFAQFMSRMHLCYLEDEFHKKEALKFFQRDAMISKEKKRPILRYILLNKDKKNSLLRSDCIPVRSKQLEESLLEISQLLYEGRFLNLYQLNAWLM